MRIIPAPILALFLIGLAAVLPARAIPEQEALEKLRVIPVHLMVDGKGVPLPIPRGKSLLLPLFLDGQRARKELADIRSRDPSLKVQLATMPLSEANGLVSKLIKDLKPGYQLVAPVVPFRQDLDIATGLLRQKGLSDAQIRNGLTLPVFYTRPFLTTQTPQGERGLLFLSHQDLQQALARAGQTPPRRVEVADITAVLRRLIQTPQDLFVFRAPQAAGAARKGLPSPPPPPPPPPALPAP
jgi:hypothetical protein